MGRRARISQARPYVVGTVAVARWWIYNDGMLCYINGDRTGRRLRILDLHGSSHDELVVRVHVLVSKAIPGSIFDCGDCGDCDNCGYVFKVVHHAAGITSCVFKPGSGPAWLLVFNAAKGVLFEPFRFEPGCKLFVRNNADFLYFGTHSVASSSQRNHRNHRWALWGFSIRNNTWSPKRIVLRDLRGDEVGSNVCFEIIDNHFYAVSTQAPTRTISKGHELYYTCFRFRVEDLESPKIQSMPWKRCWRKSPSGDDEDKQWATLKLERDEASEKLYIVEGRKVRRTDKSGTYRASYMREVVFYEENNHDGHGAEEDDSAVSGTDESDDDLDLSHNDVVLSNKTSYPRRRGFSPQHHSLHERRYTDSPKEKDRPRKHVPLDYHDASSNTFIKLINADDVPGRVHPRMFLHVESGSLEPSPASMDSSPARTNRLDQPEKIAQPCFFPPQTSEWSSEYSDLNQTLNATLNPPNPSTYSSGITAAGDERSIVYSMDARVHDLTDLGPTRPVIYISFDPAAKLAGMQPLRTVSSERAGGHSPPSSETISEEQGRDGGMSQDGPRRVRPGVTWVWRESAQYRRLEGQQHLLVEE